MNESITHSLFASNCNVFETEDGCVIAYENPIGKGGGFYGKNYDGSFVWEKYVEDLYSKHDVGLFSDYYSAIQELPYLRKLAWKN